MNIWNAELSCMGVGFCWIRLGGVIMCAHFFLFFFFFLLACDIFQVRNFTGTFIIMVTSFTIIRVYFKNRLDIQTALRGCSNHLAKYQIKTIKLGMGFPAYLDPWCPHTIFSSINKRILQCTIQIGSVLLLQDTLGHLYLCVLNIFLLKKSTILFKKKTFIYAIKYKFIDLPLNHHDKVLFQ